MADKTKQAREKTAEKIERNVKGAYPHYVQNGQILVLGNSDKSLEYGAIHMDGSITFIYNGDLNQARQIERIMPYVNKIGIPFKESVLDIGTISDLKRNSNFLSDLADRLEDSV
jgi:hypothetical protein